MGYVLKPDGIGVPGSTMEVGFDRAEAGAVTALEKLAGPVTARESCGPGTTRVVFREGLAGIFRGGEFLGWEAGERRAGFACGQVSAGRSA